MIAAGLRRTVLSVVAFAAFAASAQAFDDKAWCGASNFAQDDAGLALYRVVAARTNLLNDQGWGPGCPDPASKLCHSKVDAKRGDVLLTSKSYKGFVCAYLGGDAGWIALGDVEKLAQQPAAHPPIAAWLGEWQHGDDSIRFTRQGDGIHAAGVAYWPVNASASGAVHFGDFELDAVPTDSAAVFAGDTCTVQANLFGDYLIVKDNAGCGGVNVRFQGVFTRAKKP
jgi:hypothetical protein